MSHSDKVNTTDNVFYVDLVKYRSELEKLIDNNPDGYFALGKNKAIEGVGDRTVTALGYDISDCEEKLLEYQDDAGISDDDVLFMKGYSEGLKLAIDTQMMCATSSVEKQVAMIDPLGTITKAGLSLESFNITVKEYGVTVNLSTFPTLADMEATNKEYDACYMLYEMRDKNTEDFVYRLQLDFYKKYNKDLEMLFLTDGMARRIFDKMFIRTLPPSNYTKG